MIIADNESNVVSLAPNYDYRFEGKKIQNVHRTRSGAAYIYKWGQFKRVKFSVEDLTSASMCRINSWWGANTLLRLYDFSGTSVVVSGTLVNNTEPIDQFMAPYTDQYKGVIELEGY